MTVCCIVGLLSVCIVSSIGRWSEFSAWIVFQVVLLYSEDDMVVISGDVSCWCALFSTLVGVSVLSVMRLELESVSEISSPRWSSVYECQSVECAFTSPVIIELGMLVMY